MIDRSVCYGMWYFIEMPLHENNYEKTIFVSNIDLHFFDHLANRAKEKSIKKSLLRYFSRMSFYEPFYF